MSIVFRRVLLMLCLGGQALSLIGFGLAYAVGSSSDWSGFIAAGWIMLILAFIYLFCFGLLLVFAFIVPADPATTAAPAGAFMPALEVQLQSPRTAYARRGRDPRFVSARWPDWVSNLSGAGDQTYWLFSLGLLAFGILFFCLVAVLVFGGGSPECCSFGL